MISPNVPMSVFDDLQEESQHHSIEIDEAIASRVEAWVQPAKKRAKSVGISDRVMERLAEEVSKMVLSGDWSTATPRHFVALYVWLHREVYGIDDAGLTLKVRVTAAILSAKMLRDFFAEDQGAMAAYLRWAWRREHSREKWRRENRRSGGVLTWYALFSGKLLTDYRLQLARSGEL